MDEKNKPGRQRQPLVANWDISRIAGWNAEKLSWAFASTLTIWRGMHRRCGSLKQEKADDYIGRGITVCKEWSNFLAFLLYVGPRPSRAYTLDRINNDGNYEPGNVRWATHKEQARNRRNTIREAVDGKSIPLIELCEKRGVDYNLVRSRKFDYGMSTEEALSLKKYETKTIEYILGEEAIEKMIEDYLGGESLYEVAKKHSCSHSAVSTALKNAGVKLRRRGGTKLAKNRHRQDTDDPEFLSEFKRLRLSGCTLAKLGEQFQLGQWVTHRINKQLGLPGRIKKAT